MIKMEMFKDGHQMSSDNGENGKYRLHWLLQIVATLGFFLLQIYSMTSITHVQALIMFYSSFKVALTTRYCLQLSTYLTYLVALKFAASFRISLACIVVCLTFLVEKKCIHLFFLSYFLCLIFSWSSFIEKY